MSVPPQEVAVGRAHSFEEMLGKGIGMEKKIIVFGVSLILLFGTSWAETSHEKITSRHTFYRILTSILESSTSSTSAVAEGGVQ